MIPTIEHYSVLFYLVCIILEKKFEPFHASRSKDIVEIAKNGPIMDQTLPQYGINK